MGNHTESFQVIFDQEVISFENLLEIFFSEHDPYSRSWSVQYANVVFYENDVQREAIERRIARLESASGRSVRTRVAPLDFFTVAEDYHQKHSLRRYPDFLREITSEGSDGGEWMFSQTATRVNGYLGGYGACSELEKEIRLFGLSEGRERDLLKIVCSREGKVGTACPIP